MMREPETLTGIEYCKAGWPVRAGRPIQEHPAERRSVRRHTRGTLANLFALEATGNPEGLLKGHC